jgi:hypothetical protein
MLYGSAYISTLMRGRGLMMGEAVTNNISSMVWASEYEVKRISEIGYKRNKLWGCGNLGSRPILKHIRYAHKVIVRSIVRDIDMWLVVEEAKEVVVQYMGVKIDGLDEFGLNC